MRPSALAIGILGIALGIDLIRSRALRACGAGIRQRGAGSRRPAFFHRRVEHAVVMAGIGAVWLGERTGTDLAALCRSAGGAGRGRSDHLGRHAAGQAHDGRAAGCRAAGLAGARRAGGAGAGRRAFGRAGARAPRGQSTFRGRHHQRATNGELRAGACHQRRRRTPRRGNRSCRRDGAHGAARAGRRASFRRHPRGGASPGTGDPRAVRASARTGGCSSSCTWRWTNSSA